MAQDDDIKFVKENSIASKPITKKDLEKMGRKHKLELDRRLTKDKLVNQLHKHMKNLNK